MGYKIPANFNVILEDDNCVECPLYRGIRGFMVCLHPGADEEVILASKIGADSEYVRTPDFCPLLYGTITISKRDFLAGFEEDE